MAKRFEPEQPEQLKPEQQITEKLKSEVKLKHFIPGNVYFEYQILNSEKQSEASNEDDLIGAEYNSQCWLLCQCYEVHSNEGVRPLGLADIDAITGFAFNTWLTKITRADFGINFLDDAKTIEESLYFEVENRGLKIKIREPLAREAINIQKESQRDLAGNQLTKWIMMKLFTLNNQPITEEDLKTKYDYQLVSLLAQKVQYFLQKYLTSETLFLLPNIQIGVSETFGK